jgi:hypothetical protein
MWSAPGNSDRLKRIAVFRCISAPYVTMMTAMRLVSFHYIDHTIHAICIVRHEVNDVAVRV